MDKYLFTSESVTEGHPDKVADQISDAILDAIIAKDKNCRVACETLVTTGLALVAGEITTNCYVDMSQIARNTIKEIGYNSSAMGFDWQTCSVITSIDRQSPDIAQGVNKKDPKNQGAGDQGMMFGYATNETPELMPMPIILAHKLCQRLTYVRKNGMLNFLRPDGKSQVTVEYINGMPKSINTVLIAAQHNPNVEYNTLREAIIEEVVKKTIPDYMLNSKTKYYINTTGKFVVGGPQGDCGMTGRKIIVDTYGGMGHHGGGAFSGKDPSKVDRSGAYMARYIAKNIVAAGLVDTCEVQISYAIGIAEPISVNVETSGKCLAHENEIENAIRKTFDLKPAAIIKHLDLLNPIYKETATYGHFGRIGFPWEKTDKTKEIKKLV